MQEDETRALMPISVWSTAPDSGPARQYSATLCPFCGRDTGLVRIPASELSALSLEEFETLVRNEWRRRLRYEHGEKAYRRKHPRALIRALIVYALKPESPVRSRVVDEHLWRHVSELESWGLSRAQMRLELLSLSQAIWDVLSNAGVEFDRSCTLMERVDGKLHSTLGWPD
jgi:hypothetical protein